MTALLKRIPARGGVLVLLACIYFILFPEDLQACLAPLTIVLQLSQSISPWLYALAGVGMLVWGYVRVWGRGQQSVIQGEVKA